MYLNQEFIMLYIVQSCYIKNQKPSSSDFTTENIEMDAKALFLDWKRTKHASDGEEANKQGCIECELLDLNERGLLSLLKIQFVEYHRAEALDIGLIGGGS